MYKTSISIILASALGFGGGSAMGFSIPHSSSGSPSESTVKSDVDYKPSNDDHSDSGPRDMYDSNKGEETKNPGIKHYSNDNEFDRNPRNPDGAYESSLQRENRESREQAARERKEMEQDEETNRNTKGQEGKYEDMDLKRDEANEAWKDGSPKSEGEEFDEGMNLDYPEGEYDTANPVYEEGEYDTAGRGYSPAYRYSSSSHQDRENDEGGKSVDFSTEETSEFGRAPGEGAEMWGPPKESSTYQKYEMTQEEEKAAENDYSSGAGEEGVWSYDNEQDQQDEG